jgi:outer membrane protein TolC
MKTWIILACLSVALPLAAAERDAIAERGPLKLTLRRAVELATSSEGSTPIQLQTETIKQAKARAAQARGALLPDVESYVGVGDSVRSLASQGFGTLQLPFGVTLPPRVGPFNVLDVRATANQSVFDFSIWQRYRAARTAVTSAKEQMGDVNEKVTGDVARAYLGALRSDAEVDAIQKDVELADAVLNQTKRQKEAGTGTGIDVTRSDVQLANQKQRLLVAKNTQVRAHLTLLRAMNLRLDTQLELTDRLAYKPLDAMTSEDAVSQALANRPDLKAQLSREDTARLNASSVKYERLPSLVFQGNYGTIGDFNTTLLPTRDVYATVRVPIFDGGRRDARRAEAFSQMRQEQVRSSDLREQIELSVRVALDSLKSAEEQVQVAEEGLRLAENELAQARRRFDAGVAIGLEISDASTRLERARVNQIQAIYNQNVARIDVGEALGKTATMLD